MEGDGEKRYMGENDPYQSIRDSEAASIRPDFSAAQTSSAGGASRAQARRAGINRDSDRKSIGSKLKKAEESAGRSASTSELDARTGENEVSSGFTNNVGKNGQVPGDSQNNGGFSPYRQMRDQTRAAAGQDSKASGPVGRFMKKYAPIVSIVLTLTGSSSFMMLSQAALPFTALSGLKDWFNSIDISNYKRHSGIMQNSVKNMLRPPSQQADFKNPVKGKKYKLSKKFTQRLSAQNIEIPTTGEHKGKMIFTDANGNQKAIAPKDFKVEYDTNPEFRKAYSSASHPYKTAFNNFKDKIFKKFKAAFGLDGSKWGKGYNPESDPDGKKAKETVQDGMDQDNGTAKTSKGDVADVDDGNGGTKKMPEVEPDSAGGQKPKTTTGDTDLPKVGDDGGQISNKLKSIGAVAGAAMGVLSLDCAFSAIAGSISMIAAAEQLYRVINIAMDYFSAFDQAIAGEGSTSPIHAFGKSLVQESESTYETAQYTGAKNPTSEDQVNDAVTTDTKTVRGSAVTSQGFNSLFSHEQVDGRDTSVRSFNTFEQIKEGTASFAYDVTKGLNNFRQCTYTRIAQAAIQAGMDGITLLACVFSAGAGCLVDFLIDAGKSAAIAGLVTIASKIAADIFTSWFKNFLTNLLTNELSGTVLGDSLVAGMHAIMAGNHRAGGGVYADQAGYIETSIVQSEVLADKAKTERLTRSPFDYTSRYTFMGSLITAMIPITLQSKSVIGALNNFGTVFSNSVSSLLPGASAANAGISAAEAEEYTKKNCPYLYDIGAVGDAYCQPYTTTDFDTINIDNESIGENDDPTEAINSPYNILEQVDGYGGFDLGGESLENVENPKIDKESDLADYIIYCNQRQSALGIADQNFAAEIDGTSTGSSIGDFARGLVPFVGDGADIIGATRTLEKFGYVDGSACVMHDGGEGKLKVGSKIPEYTERRAYARYIEDQRYLESAGMIEQSAVTAFLDEYYEEHPLDNSYEGIIARMSGLPKETVIAVYDAIDFMNFVAEYDPTDYYPTPAIHPEEPDYTIEDNRIIKDETFVAIIQTGYFSEYRQRNFASA